MVIALLLLVVEVVMGMTLGIALAGSLAFFTLAVLEVIGLLSGLNNYLIIGSILFVVYAFLVLRFFRHSFLNKNEVKDINDYWNQINSPTAFITVGLSSVYR